MERFTIKFKYENEDQEDKLRKIFHKYGLTFYTSFERKGEAISGGSIESMKNLLSNVRKENISFELEDYENLQKQ